VSIFDNPAEYEEWFNRTFDKAVSNQGLTPPTSNTRREVPVTDSNREARIKRIVEQTGVSRTEAERRVNVADQTTPIEDMSREDLKAAISALPMKAFTEPKSPDAMTENERTVAGFLSEDAKAAIAAKFDHESEHVEKVYWEFDAHRAAEAQARGGEDAPGIMPTRHRLLSAAATETDPKRAALMRKAAAPDFKPATRTSLFASADTSGDATGTRAELQAGIRALPREAFGLGAFPTRDDE
jgi:hypothetical protein